ncbi:MAG: hypothetical protein IKC69_05860 [Clostridia bacterium]|nr:hypothetical protein [Clostridia bacterium]
MNDEINTEVETAAENDVEEIVVGDADVEEDLDGDFEYDENGDIIIPDESEDGEVSEDDGEEVGTEEEQDETDEDGEAETEVEDQPDTPEPEVVEPVAEQPDAKDRELAELRRKYAALESQSKDTLAKLGVTEGDVMDGLVKLAAEADDMTPEEYLKQKTERDKAEEAKRIVQNMEFEKMIKADLAEVHAAYPETRVYDSVKKFPNFEKFGRFRDLGLSPKEAYIAANPDAVRASVAAATKKQSLNETKSHLSSVAPKKSKDTSVTMTKSELKEYRDLFPELSDKERMALYRRVSKK